MWNTNCENSKAVTPHDTNPIQNAANETIKTKFIIVTVAGTIACVNKDGVTVSIQAAAGIPIPVATSVITTASTATGIVALW